VRFSWATYSSSGTAKPKPEMGFSGADPRPPTVTLFKNKRPRRLSEQRRALHSHSRGCGPLFGKSSHGGAEQHNHNNVSEYPGFALRTNSRNDGVEQHNHNNLSAHSVTSISTLSPRFAFSSPMGVCPDLDRDSSTPLAGTSAGGRSVPRGGWAGVRPGL
jgi:hypothetical protein